MEPAARIAATVAAGVQCDQSAIKRALWFVHVLASVLRALQGRRRRRHHVKQIS